MVRSTTRWSSKIAELEAKFARRNPFEAIEDAHSLSYPHPARSFIMDPLDLLPDFLARLIG
jgi:hypothetical protein